MLDEATKLGAKKAISIEPSSNNVKLAKQYYPHVLTIQGTAEGFESEDKFDVVIAIMSFSHVNNIDKALTNIAHVMKKATKLLLIIPDYDYYKTNRSGREVIVEKVSENQYVAMVKRPHGSIADIVRKQSVYQNVASKHGLRLIVFQVLEQHLGKTYTLVDATGAGK